jgi:hypothetical protein
LGEFAVALTDTGAARFPIIETFISEGEQNFDTGVVGRGAENLGSFPSGPSSVQVPIYTALWPLKISSDGTPDGICLAV